MIYVLSDIHGNKENFDSILEKTAYSRRIPSTSLETSLTAILTASSSYSRS